MHNILKTALLLATLTFSFLLLTGRASGHVFQPGEIFEVLQTGTQYCGDLLFQEFEVTSFAVIDSDTQFRTCETPNCDTGEIFINTYWHYLISPTELVFAASDPVDPGEISALQGRATIEDGRIAAFSGTFVFRTAPSVCFAVGNFTMVGRVE